MSDLGCAYMRHRRSRGNMTKASAGPRISQSSASRAVSRPPRMSIDSSVVLACASNVKNRDMTAMVQRSENKANALPPQANSPFPKGMLDHGYKEVSTHSSIHCSVVALLTISCASRQSPRTVSRGYYISNRGCQHSLYRGSIAHSQLVWIREDRFSPVKRVRLVADDGTGRDEVTSDESSLHE